MLMLTKSIEPVFQNFAPAERETISTVPFMKNNEFDYSKISFLMDESSQEEWAWIIFIPIGNFHCNSRFLMEPILQTELMDLLQERVW